LPLRAWFRHYDPRAASSAFVRETLGSDFLDVFLAIKRQERERFGALVTDRDYEWYLDTA
jgi:glutamine synthetase